MNYIGSKYTLLPFLSQTIKEVVGENLSNIIFCDLFAGTGIVGRHFKPEVKKIIANDIEYYSYILNRNYIGNHKEIKDKESYIEVLNKLPKTTKGFIYNNYCQGSGSGRQYFSDENGIIIDTVRAQIENWHNTKEISEDLYYFLLCSLLESADKLANTTSVYGAFLKHIKKTAKKSLQIEPANFVINTNEHEVFCEDANSLIKKISGDILYLDPPYNSRQYGANYHILNTIAEYKPFTPKGKTGLREYTRSLFCGKNTVCDAFESLIKEAQFKYIFLSYNNEGLMSTSDIKRIMSKYGQYDVICKEYSRYRADKENNRTHKANKTIEYIHILYK